VGEVRAEGYDTRPVSFITVKEDHMWESTLLRHQALDCSHLKEGLNQVIDLKPLVTVFNSFLSICLFVYFKQQLFIFTIRSLESRRWR
jgi:hypothetical protein